MSQVRSEMTVGDREITLLIKRWGDGDSSALGTLLPMVYAELRRLARIQLAARGGHSTLQPTALVNDVLLRLIDRDQPQVLHSRAHLYNTAARIMRQMLVDRARSAAADKHGGGWLRDDFTQAMALPVAEIGPLVEIDEALSELAALEPRMAEVVQLRYFVGLSVAEVAAVLDVEERTIYRDWAAARAWLKTRLQD